MFPAVYRLIELALLFIVDGGNRWKGFVSDKDRQGQVAQQDVRCGPLIT
jgi:hypothetical protein